MKSRRKICTYGPTEPSPLMTLPRSCTGRQAGRRSGRQARDEAGNLARTQPACLLDFFVLTCEVVFALADLYRLRHKSAVTPSSHSPTHGI